MPYQILDVDANIFVCSDTAFEPLQFDTGEEANTRAKELAANGRKYRVKRVLDENWKHREAAKFNAGKYQHLPWIYSEWWTHPASIKIHQFWYAHVSKKEPGMIAYTPNAEFGMDNKKLRVTPDKFLANFKDSIAYHGFNINHLAQTYTAQTTPKPVFFAKTPDEIEFVYRNGPESCMSSDKYRYNHGWGYPSKGKWPYDTHACRVYGAGDLEVAYMLQDPKKPKGPVTARALVWPAKKTHSRCYGEEVRLKTALVALGYKFGPPIGAKLLRLPFKGSFIVPYIDQGDRSGQGALAIKDMKDHMLIVKQEVGTYPANATSGLAGGRYLANGQQDDGTGHCFTCDTDQDDTVRVYTSGAPGDNRHMCLDCRTERDVYLCAASGRYYDPQYIEHVTLTNGEIWSSRSFDEYGFVCEATGARLHRSQRTLIKVNEAGKVQYWSAAHAQTHSFQCRYTGDRYALDQKVKMANGQEWSKQAVKHAGFVCDDCEGTFQIYDRPDMLKKVCAACAALKPTTAVKSKRKKIQPTTTDEALDALIASLKNPEEQERDRI